MTAEARNIEAFLRYMEGRMREDLAKAKDEYSYFETKGYISALSFLGKTIREDRVPDMGGTID